MVNTGLTRGTRICSPNNRSMGQKGGRSNKGRFREFAITCYIIMYRPQKPATHWSTPQLDTRLEVSREEMRLPAILKASFTNPGDFRGHIRNPEETA